MRRAAQWPRLPHVLGGELSQIPFTMRGALGKSQGHPTGALEIHQDKQARGPAKTPSEYRAELAKSALEDRLPRLLFGGPFAPYALSGGPSRIILPGSRVPPSGIFDFAGQRDWNEKAGTSSRDALSWAHQINAVYLRSCQRQEIPAYEQE